MVSFWLLAHAEAAAEHGFGLNPDLLETNIFNLVIVIGVLFYFGRQVVGNILSERRSRIETAIGEAEKRQKDAAAALAAQQQKLTQAQAEAERIKAEAAQRAATAKEAILAQAKADVERLRSEAVQDLSAARERAIAEVRARVTAMALERVEGQLKSQLDEGKQQKLVDRSIASIGGGR
ncbi:F0F1 ATP synthase subunit B [[Phormidium] sp. ETS-05]|uniref:F0F1 ATP synthase subunit B n=1 Tax=[Phormidium] sp. ETS-05 TaxID=222819 RepID=UPI001E60F40A|nr:F0F1 ATP synthase subunit B [[Phormidium] sp. ETS-05]